MMLQAALLVGRSFHSPCKTPCPGEAACQVMLCVCPGISIACDLSAHSFPWPFTGCQFCFTTERMQNDMCIHLIAWVPSIAFVACLILDLVHHCQLSGVQSLRSSMPRSDAGDTCHEMHTHANARVVRSEARTIDQ